jgi:hypothetical protein
VQRLQPFAAGSWVHGAWHEAVIGLPGNAAASMTGVEGLQSSSLVGPGKLPAYSRSNVSCSKGRSRVVDPARSAAPEPAAQEPYLPRPHQTFADCWSMSTILTAVLPHKHMLPGTWLSLAPNNLRFDSWSRVVCMWSKTLGAASICTWFPAGRAAPGLPLAIEDAAYRLLMFYGLAAGLA